MQNQEAFVYCWTDHRDNKFYVGYHKGRKDDGYICSQPLFLEQYNKRPQDFTRMILAEGTAVDCHALEIAILKAAGAKRSDRFYNQSNGCSSDFVCKGHTEETRKRLSTNHEGQIPWNKGKKCLKNMGKIFQNIMACEGKRLGIKVKRIQRKLGKRNQFQNKEIKILSMASITTKKAIRKIGLLI